MKEKPVLFTKNKTIVKEEQDLDRGTNIPDIYLDTLGKISKIISRRFYRAIDNKRIYDNLF